MTRKQTKLWTTKDGRRIRICDMNDNHLSNTIAMLEHLRPALECEFINEAESMLCCLQGEMAIYSVEREVDRVISHGLFPREIHPLYPNLLLDQERRLEK